MRKLDWLVLLVAGAASSLWCLSTARELGPTFDEPFYLQGGLEFWREGRPGKLLRAGTMPLPIQVETFPLYLTERLTGHVWTWPDDLPAMLTIARAGTLVFWWVLLVYSFLLARSLGGPWAGRLAVVLVALEPSLLAHAGLATTDLALAACLLAFVYHFRAGRDLGWGWRVALPTVLFAVAMLAKASTLTFAPLLMIGVELERLFRTKPGEETTTRPYSVSWWWTAFRLLRRDALVICGVGIVLALVLCGTDGDPLPQVGKNLAGIADGNPVKPFLAAAAELPVWPNSLHTLWFQIKHNLIGHATYLLGYEHPRALWFYFPVLLTMKVTAVVLLLLLVGLLAPGPRLNLALGLAGLLFLFSFTCRVQLGIRFLLPLLSLLLIGLAVRYVGLLAAMPAGWRGVGIAVVAVAVGGMAVGTARVWPDPLRYINEVWGGTEDGYRLVSDSNYDWGQGLPELAAWRERNDVPLTIWSFKADPRFPDLVRYHTHEGLTSPKLAGRHLAVGVSLLYGAYTHTPPDRELKALLRGREPVARTRTYLIYAPVTP